MTLKEVTEYLKGLVQCGKWYRGKLFGNDEHCIGVFPTQGPAPTIPIGGITNSSYKAKAVSLLIHWGKDIDEAENKAQEVFRNLYGQEHEIGGKRVVKLDFRTSEPVGIGTDDKGIFEYVINFVIYYSK